MKDLFDKPPTQRLFADRPLDTIENGCVLSWKMFEEQRALFTEIEHSKQAFTTGFEAGFALCELLRLSEQ